LTENEMPSHNHSVTLANNGYPDGSGDRTANYYLMHPTTGNQYAYGSDYKGGNAPHTNMPPYYVLAFIMRVQ
jgi:microcystin-dependent protein